MSTERFDFVVALYAFCGDYHSGQWSRGYRLRCRIDSHYRPQNIPSDLGELFRRRKDYREALYIYLRLARSAYANKM